MADHSLVLSLVAVLALSGCGVDAQAQKPITDAPPVYSCEPIEEITVCSTIGYPNASFPNYRDQVDQAEVDSELQNFIPLIENQCSNALVHFLCSVYAPFCELEYVNIRVPPCRQLCEYVRSTCEDELIQFNLNWPPHLDCEQYPVFLPDQGIVCFHIPDPSMLMIPKDIPGVNLNEPTTNSTPPCSGLCEECDEQCLGGCTNGTGPEHCTFCRNYLIETGSGAATETVCVGACPIGTWLNMVTKQCIPCSVHCRDGCAGPLPYLNLTDGCLECDVVELDRDGGQVKCVRVCDVGTYKDTLTEGENEVLEELLPELLVCRPCHELCKDCVGPGILRVGGDCRKCAVVANQTNYCAEGCHNTTEFQSNEFCQPCDPSCYGCSGMFSTNCDQCNEEFVKDFLGDITDSFVCRSECDPSDYASEEGVCETCHPNCRHCIASSSYNCTECQDNSADFQVVAEATDDSPSVLLCCALGERITNINGTCELVLETSAQSTDPDYGAIAAGVLAGLIAVTIVIVVILVGAWIYRRSLYGHPKITENHETPRARIAPGDPVLNVACGGVAGGNQNFTKMS